MFLLPLIGIGIIVTGVLAWLISQSPFWIGGLSWLLSMFSFGNTSSVTTQIQWWANNLEIVLPIGIFIMFVYPPAPQRLLPLTIACLVAGVALWMMGL